MVKTIYPIPTFLQRGGTSTATSSWSAQTLPLPKQGEPVYSQALIHSSKVSNGTKPSQHPQENSSHCSVS